MNDDLLKEANRLHWMVKGFIKDMSEEECKQVIDGYTKRLWGNCEGSEDGFDEAWNEFLINKE